MSSGAGHRTLSVLTEAYFEIGSTEVRQLYLLVRSCRSGFQPRFAPARRSCSKIFCNDRVYSFPEQLLQLVLQCIFASISLSRRPGRGIPEQCFQFPVRSISLIRRCCKGMRIDIEIATEIGARLVRHVIGNRFPTLLRCNSIEKLAHPTYVQLNPAVRTLFMSWQRQQQVRKRTSTFPACIYF